MTKPKIPGKSAALVMRQCLTAVLVICVFGAAIAAEQSDKAATRQRALFNGKNLDGWKNCDFVGTGEVSVSEGTLVMGAGNSMTGVKCSRKDLPTTDYEAGFEAKRVKGNDFFAALTFPVGKSHATFVNGGWGSSVTGVSSINGSDASENETNTYYPYKNDVWYRFRVRVTDKRIRCWVNDKMVVDLELEDRRIDTRIETDECKPLGFASWESSGVVRNIHLKSLTAAEIKATNEPDEQD